MTECDYQEAQIQILAIQCNRNMTMTNIAAVTAVIARLWVDVAISAEFAVDRFARQNVKISATHA